MAGVRELLVRFGGKIDPSLGNAAGKAGREIDRIGDSAEKSSKRSRGAFGLVAGGARAIIGPLAAVGAAAKSLDFAKGAVGLASDLEEAGSKMNQIFGAKGAAQISAFAGGAARALGQTSLEVQNAAAMFGVFGKSAGLTGTKLAAFSEDFVRLSTDLASFHNAEPQEVVEALGAALRGEAEPMRRFGVLLDDATMRQEALKLGLIKTTKEALTPQQKVLAAQALIMRQTKDAQGDFAKTSGGLANQQRILTATWKEAQAKLGGALLPLVLRATTALNAGLGPAMKAAEDAGRGLSGIWSILSKGDFTGSANTFGLEEDSGAVDVLFRIRDALLEVRGGVRAFRAAWTAFNGDVTSSGFPGFMERLAFVARGAFEQVIAGARALAAGFRQNVLPGIREVIARFQGFAAVVTPIVTQVVGFVINQFAKWAPTIRRYITQITQIVGDTMRAIGAVIGRATQLIRWVWDRWGAGILAVAGRVFGDIVRAIGGALNVAQGIVRTILAVIRGDWSGAWAGIKQITSGALTVVGNLLRAAGRILGGLARAAGGLVVDGFRWMRDKAVGAMTSLRDGVTRKMDDARRWVGEKLGRLKAGVVDMFKGIAGAVSKPFNSITGAIVKPLRSAATWLNKNILSPMNSVTSKFGISIPQIPKFHTGGMVPGRDELGAILLGGEGVLSRRGVQTVGGPRAVDDLNAGRLPANSGGAVGKVWDWLKDKGQQIRDLAAKGSRWVLDRIFSGATTLAASFPPPMAGGLLQGAAMMMRDAVLRRGKEEDDKNANNYHGPLNGGKVVGGRAWPTTSRALSGSYPGHSGIDIPVPVGTPLFAAANGRIDYTGWGRGYGNAIFANFQGWPAVYGHGSRPLVSAGQQVRAGQVIGLSGNTGRSTGPHLHFEIAPGGRFAQASNRGATLRWLGYDQGGWLPPGMHATYNATGKPEAVLTTEQWERLFTALENLANTKVVVDGQSMQAVVREEVRAAVSTVRRGERTLV